MSETATPTAESSTRLSRLKSIQSVTDRGVRYERRWTDCGNKRCKKCTNAGSDHRTPTHGPYWYMLVLDPVTHRRRTIYLGDRLDTTLYRTPEGGFDHDAHAARPKRQPKAGTTQDDPEPLDLSSGGSLRQAEAPCQPRPQ